jgi:hypothetical protein
MERLERRELLSADLVTWPAGVGYAADFINHGGAGVTTRRFGPAQGFIGATSIDLLTSKVGLTRQFFVGSDHDLNGAPFFPDGQNRVPAMYVNGGLGSSAPNAEAAVYGQWEIFVDQGGSYLGSCRGFYAARRPWDLKMGHSGGKGYQTFVLPEGDPITDYVVLHGVTDRTIRDVRHYSGPRVTEKHAQPPGTKLYGAITKGVSRGAFFALRHEPEGGEGMVDIVVGHPEFSRPLKNGQPSTGMLFAAGWLDHGIRRGQRTPDLKGSIDVGETIAMVGATEKVGDGQYHRWSVTVPQGTLSLTITLTGLSDNADLFVQREGYAHEHSYAWSSVLPGTTPDTITILNPLPGEYEVSVRGTHDVANGAAYTLTVNSEVIIDPSAWQNPANHFDVNDDQVVTPLDLMILLEDYRINGPRELPVEKPHDAYFLDVNGDKTFDRLDLIELFDELFSLPA